METLKLLRSQPRDNQPVRVHFQSLDGLEYGLVELPKAIWVSFSKILQEGLATNLKSPNPYPLKIVIEGFIPEEVKQAPEAGGSIDKMIRTLRRGDDE